MIKLKDVQKVYRTKTIETLALDSIDLEVREGAFVSIMGPSGCGKSTLLNIIGLLDEPTAGTVELGGQVIREYNNRSVAQFRNRHLGFIFQSFHLISELSVLDNVEMPLIYRNVSGAQRRKMALAALEQVDLQNRITHFPGQLSGGQKQRVAIARAIVGEPDIILADEPTGNLDSVMGNEILQILKRLNQDHKTTVVMVTHNQVMADQTEKTIRLFDGSKVA